LITGFSTTKKKLCTLFIPTVLILFSCSERSTPTGPVNGSKPPEKPSWIGAAKQDSAAINALIIGTGGKLYAATAGNGILISRDNGINWESFNAGLSDSIIECLAIDSSGIIWAGTHTKGLFRYSDSEKLWKSVSLYNQGVFSLGTGLHGRLFAATYHSIIHSDDEGHTWISQSSVNIDGQVLDFLFLESDTIFAGTLVNGIIRSDDNGEYWNQTVISQITIPSLIENNKGELLAGSLTQGGFISRNGGTTWEIMDGGFGGGAYQFIQNSSDYIYCCQYQEGIYRSTDSGFTWKLVNLDLTDLTVTSLCLDQEEHIIVGTYKGRIFRSNFSSTIHDL
jgi:ligand-binding sensor domain-containing protein